MDSICQKTTSCSGGRHSMPRTRFRGEPPRSFIRLVTLTFDLLILELVCNVTRGTGNLLHCPVMGKHASNWRRDVITLTFDLWGHCAYQWRGSSHSIHKPSLIFLGLPVLDIWLIFGHVVNRYGDLDLWPLRSTRWSVMRCISSTYQVWSS